MLPRRDARGPRRAYLAGREDDLHGLADAPGAPRRLPHGVAEGPDEARLSGSLCR